MREGVSPPFCRIFEMPEDRVYEKRISSDDGAQLHSRGGFLIVGLSTAESYFFSQRSRDSSWRWRRLKWREMMP